MAETKIYRVPFTIHGEAIVRLDPSEAGNAYPEWYAKGLLESAYVSVEFSDRLAPYLLRVSTLHFSTGDADEFTPREEITP